MNKIYFTKKVFVNKIIKIIIIITIIYLLVQGYRESGKIRQKAYVCVYVSISLIANLLRTQHSRVGK